jgi:hypothetical protein
MRRLARRAWGILAVAGLMVVLTAWPSAASADLEVTHATIEGRVTSTSAPPGSVLPASVTGNATGADVWRGTSYRFLGSNGSRCMDTGNSSGNQTVNFNVTAPGAPGDYDAGFTATGENNCTGTQSDEKVLTHALSVTRPGPNTDLPPRCGINVMLVLDRSGSIGTAGQTETVRIIAEGLEPPEYLRTLR